LKEKCGESFPSGPTCGGWHSSLLADDSAFSGPEILEALEEQGVLYILRIPPSDNPERDIAVLLTRRACGSSW
jgi:hypothetical protein